MLGIIEVLHSGHIPPYAGVVRAHIVSALVSYRLILFIDSFTCLCQRNLAQVVLFIENSTRECINSMPRLF